jgi:hypothetical protein
MPRRRRCRLPAYIKAQFAPEQSSWRLQATGLDSAFLPLSAEPGSDTVRRARYASPGVLPAVQSNTAALGTVTWARVFDLEGRAHQSAMRAFDLREGFQ